tara:strand:- start:695 stop:946 length:252 start_codon:yes stop_codon:yes gene_type:complete
MDIRIWERGKKINMNRVDYINTSSENHEEEILKYYTNSMITTIKEYLIKKEDEQELFNKILHTVKQIKSLNDNDVGNKKRRHC